MATYTSPQDGTTLDTYLQSSAATTNFNTNTAILAGEYNAGSAIYRTLLQFPGLTDGSIPSAAIVSSASLFIKTQTDYSSNARTLRAYRSKRDVNFGQTTYNIWKTESNWETAGGFGANDCEQTDIGSVSVAASGVNTWYEIQLTPSAIQEIINGTWTTPYIFLKMDTEADDLWNFYSSNHATSGNRPYIVVTYNDRSGAPIFFD